MTLAYKTGMSVEHNSNVSWYKCHIPYYVTLLFVYTIIYQL